MLGCLATCPSKYPPMPLTDLAIRQAKPGPKPTKFFDARGLYLLIKPAGQQGRGKQRQLMVDDCLSTAIDQDISAAFARAVPVRDELFDLPRNKRLPRFASTPHLRRHANAL